MELHIRLLLKKLFIPTFVSSEIPQADTKMSKNKVFMEFWINFRSTEDQLSHINKNYLKRNVSSCQETLTCIKLCSEVTSRLSDLTLTVVVAPLALSGGLRDAQQAADGVGGAQRVGLRRLGRGDR